MRPNRRIPLGPLCLLVTLLAGCDSTENDVVTLEYAKGRLTKGGVTSSLTIDDDWGNGFCGTVTIVNKGRRTVTNWRLALQRNGAEIGRKWEGVSVDSEHLVVVSPTTRNATIPVGATVSVPFCGSGSGRPALQSMSVDAHDPPT